MRDRDHDWRWKVRIILFLAYLIKWRTNFSVFHMNEEMKINTCRKNLHMDLSLELHSDIRYDTILSTLESIMIYMSAQKKLFTSFRLKPQIQWFPAVSCFESLSNLNLNWCSISHKCLSLEGNSMKEVFHPTFFESSSFLDAEIVDFQMAFKYF